MKIMQLRVIPAAFAAVALILAGAGIPAAAQEPAPAASPAAANLDDDTIKAFAVASLEVEALNKKYRPQLDSIESSEEQEQLRQEAVAEMTKAVEAAGLEIDTYNEIIQAAQGDEELANRIIQYREELQ